MVNCTAKTLKNVRCKRSALSGKSYCALHQKQIVDSVNVGQREVTDPKQDEGGPGLVDDVWQFIAVDFTLLEVRPLALTCKYLYRVFTSDMWFSRHPRCLLVHTQKGKPIASKYQSKITEQVMSMRTNLYDKYQVIIGGLVQPEGIPADDWIPVDPDAHVQFRKLGPMINVVNSYVKAREIYRSLWPRGKIKAHSIVFDVKESALFQTLISLSIRLRVDDIWDCVGWIREGVSIIFGALVDKQRMAEICDLILSQVKSKPHRYYELSTAKYTIKDNVATFSIYL